MTANAADAQTSVFSTDVVVIGAGPAGLFQAFQLGLQGLSCHVIEALPHPGGQCAELYPHKPIYDIPAIADISGYALGEQLQQQLAAFAVQWHWGHTAIALSTLPDDGGITIQTDLGHTIHSKAVVLALGIGAFVPRKAKLEHLDALLSQARQVFLQSHDRAAPVAGQHVVVWGGDEAAVRKALTLAQLPDGERPQRIQILHRRDVFKAEDGDLDVFNALRAQGQIEVVIGQLQALNVDIETVDTATAAVAFQSLQLLDNEGTAYALPADVLLVYQGISPKLGAMQDWGLTLESKQIVVHPIRMQTNLEGVYAIGDIATYPGKRKLIATAFQEGIMAAYAIAEYLQDTTLPTLYTTTNTLLLERLGKQPVDKP